MRSEADLQALVASLPPGQSIRAVGATHSHAPLVACDDVIVDLQALSGVVEVDQARKTAWVWAGTRIHTLGPLLHQYGLALPNQGDIDQQAIAGAVATGTHGTGTTLRNLSAAVVGMRIVLADGSLQTWEKKEGQSSDDEPPFWQVARLNLGAFGIITQLKLSLVASFRLAEQTLPGNLAATMQRFEEQAAKHRHCEFFWYPQSDEASLKCISQTDKSPQYPLGAEGERCAWSYEVLPNHRPHKHTEMEYSVPAELGPQCLKRIATLLQTQFQHVRWPVEYRTLAADDVWLSTAYARQTATISVHEDVKVDEQEYYAACEAIFLEHEGRPHWGKVHHLSGAQLRQAHPKWDDWWAIRDTLDPADRFLNPYLRALRDSS